MNNSGYRKDTNSGNDPKLDTSCSVPDDEKLPDGQFRDHWVLPESERKAGFIRPVRDLYKHVVCGVVTKMPRKIAETYAREPTYYGSTFCCGCSNYFPVDQFVWFDTKEKVGS